MWVVAHNTGPLSAQSRLILGILLVVWFWLCGCGRVAWVLTGRSHQGGPARRDCCRRRHALPSSKTVWVVCVVLLTLLAGQMTSGRRIIRTELRDKPRYAALAMSACKPHSVVGSQWSVGGQCTGARPRPL